MLGNMFPETSAVAYAFLILEEARQCIKGIVPQHFVNNNFNRGMHLKYQTLFLQSQCSEFQAETNRILCHSGLM